MERTQGRVVRVPSLANRLKMAVLDRRETSQWAKEQAVGPTVQERQLALIHFYQEYETLVETLCDAAQYGPTSFLEKAYLSVREWMQENYPQVGRYAVAYLQFEVDDRGDAFEALFSSPDLATFLQTDDGNMISRIMRTREALNRYGDHLRQLAAA